MFSRVAGSPALHRAPLNELAPCITRLFSGHLACPVPEKGASGTEYLLRTGKACFLHRVPLKMRRVPQEPVFCTARIFRTVEACFWYRVRSVKMRRVSQEALSYTECRRVTRHHLSESLQHPPLAQKKKSRLNVTSIGTSEKRQLPTLPPGGAVPSALVSLTSLFGMGRGGSSPL